MSSDNKPTVAEAARTDSRTEKLNTKAAALIGLAVMCSRLLGLARDMIFAALFGSAGAMDAFTAAFRIPNLLRDLFAEGALSTAFVTTFSKTIVRGDDAAAWRLANKVATMATVVLGLVCVAGVVFAPQIVFLVASGFKPAQAELTVHLTRIMFPFILLVSLAALVMGMLNAKNVFGMPAMASSFFNIGSIVGGVLISYWIDPHFGPAALTGLAIATVLGGLMQLSVQLPSLRRVGYHFRPDFRWRDPGVRSILLLMGPSVIAASTTQVNVLINSTFASYLGEGPIIWLAMAFRLMQLPLGLFGVALGTVTLPLLSRLVAAGNLTGVRTELAHGLRLAFILTLPCTVGLMMLAEPIMSMLFQHGKTTAEQVAQAGGALRFYAIGLTGYAALKVLVNAFYAMERRKTPMVVSFVAVALNLAFNWLFTFHLGFGHRGLALSTGLIAACNFLLLYALMRRYLHGLETVRLLKLTAKIGIACAAMGSVCYLSNRFVLDQWATMPLPSKVPAVLLTVTLGAIVYGLMGLLLRIDELHQLAGAVRRRLKR